MSLLVYYCMSLYCMYCTHAIAYSAIAFLKTVVETRIRVFSSCIGSPTKHNMIERTFINFNVTPLLIRSCTVA